MNPNNEVKTFTIKLSGVTDESLKELFGDTKSMWGEKSEPLPGVTIVNKTEDQRGMVDLVTVAFFVLNYAVGVSGNLLASWLYERLKDGKAEKLEINGLWVRIDKKSIEDALATSSNAAPEKP